MWETTQPLVARRNAARPGTPHSDTGHCFRRAGRTSAQTPRHDHALLFLPFLLFLLLQGRWRSWRCWFPLAPGHRQEECGCPTDAHTACGPDLHARPVATSKLSRQLAAARSSLPLLLLLLLLLDPLTALVEGVYAPLEEAAGRATERLAALGKPAAHRAEKFAWMRWREAVRVTRVHHAAQTRCATAGR